MSDITLQEALEDGAFGDTRMDVRLTVRQASAALFVLRLAGDFGVTETCAVAAERSAGLGKTWAIAFAEAVALLGDAMAKALDEPEERAIYAAYLARFDQDKAEIREEQG